MLPEGSVRASHLWKRFRADRPPRRLLDLLEGLPARFDRQRPRPHRWRWALRDVGFAIEPGESVGLIGTNGSGKSTLLKIVNQIMYPYAGSVDVAGRIGALIDVRSGIHPQLTGRENVFMFGALLGLSRAVVAARFDEIIAFAELESAVDRQVKFYSSGMQMRLGFSVAAFLEPDVLLVDEVLAVGDTSFQQRCLEKMRSVQQQGTTLVLVSHDLGAVEATCARSIWLDQGTVVHDGPTGEVLAAYRARVDAIARAEVLASGPVRVREVRVSGPDAGSPRTHEPLALRIALDSDTTRSVRVYAGLTEGVPSPVFVVERDVELHAGPVVLECRVRRLPLPRGRFAVWLAVVDEAGPTLVSWRPVAELDVMGPALDPAPGGVARAAPVVVDAEWELVVR
jgi:ABC-2 type transport system ATP-binding protein